MTPPATRQPAQPLVELSGLAAGVLWRRRVWGWMAVFGVLAGVLATLAMPPLPTATTKVLIARVDDTATSQPTLMETDLALLRTTPTATSALQRLHLDLAPTDFLKTFEGEAVSSNVLLITAQGPTDHAAVLRARAVADAFITTHVERVRSEARAQAQALLDHRGELERRFAELTDQISSASPETVDLLAQRRAGLTSQIVDLGQQVQEALAGVPRVEAGTRIVDPPRALAASFALTAATNLAAGLALGLFGGIALAAVLCVTRDRPVLRRDIAAQLGMSVVISLPSRRRGRVRTRGRGARTDERGTNTLVRLIRASPGRVSVLELGCSRTAAAFSKAIAEKLGGERPIDVGSIDPGTSWVELEQLGTHALLIVRAGSASTWWLHTVARRLAEVGITPVGLVLVSPYPWDNTDGALWNGQQFSSRYETFASYPVSKESGLKVP